MKGLKKLVIENFQSHERTEIDFVFGLNVLVGPSDSGKSAILRALRWVLFNMPRGTDFIRRDADRCQVTLTLMDNTQIIRLRSASINRYTLINPEGQEQIFEGFGNTVPHEILEAHQIKPLKLDEKWEMIVHAGNQLEGPFLLSESSIAKAKIIGSISGAQLIDRALKGTIQDRKQLSKKMRLLEEQAEALAHELKPYENLSTLEEEVQKAQVIYQAVKEKQRKLQRLREIAKYYHEIQKEKEQQLSILKDLENVPLLEQKQLEIEMKALERKQLKSLCERWMDNQHQTKICKERILQTEKLPVAEKTFSEVRSKKEQLIALRNSQVKWEQTKQALDHVKDKLKQCQHVPQAQNRIEGLVAKVVRLHHLQGNRELWKRLKSEKDRVEKTISSTQGVSDLQNNMELIETKKQKMQHLAGLYDDLIDTKKRIKAGREYYLTRQHEIESLSDLYVELLKEQGNCPTCGNQVDSSKLLEHLLEEYMV
ncbi:AAA family ATPase [Thermoflavimicrobium daqui]|uniref:Nuclease SbcCD subunit C n=1 Tax=Thermoflavimicrobium daqui TaxID=2137476 RepID=A0A364K7X3_9BACL|nr:AAA family ATPase [Thermoflavimicrobium daqui]RAL26399.1 hypothetical protein DL897_05250 [Thermoflavimicrobium daqui]